MIQQHSRHTCSFQGFDGLRDLQSATVSPCVTGFDNVNEFCPCLYTVSLADYLQTKLKGTHISFDFKKIKYARKRFLLLQNLQVWSGN